MKSSIFPLVILLCCCNAKAFGNKAKAHGLAAPFATAFEPDISVTGIGIDLVSNGVCTPGGLPANCAAIAGGNVLTVGPGAPIALYLEWTNDGVTTIVEVAVTDENGDNIFDAVTTPLGPNESTFAVVFFDAPTLPGQYPVPLTVTATNVDNRQASTLTRYILEVDATLPVGLRDFTARADGKQTVELQWLTIWEEDNAGFTVERRNAYEDFTPLDLLPNREVLATEIRYHLRDETAPAGTLFYRLRQSDISGAVHYSPIIQVRVEPENWLPYPNPVADRLYLPPAVQATLFDAAGRNVTNKAAASSWLEVAELPAGTYWLRVGNDIFSIVKQ